MMSPAEMLVRIGVGAFLILVGFLLQAGWVSIVIMFVGAGWIIWTVFRAVRQVKRAEAIQRERHGG